MYNECQPISTVFGKNERKKLYPFPIMIMFTYYGDVYISYYDDVYLKKITTRMSQNLILHKNADQPKV
jgi:hypothetical protein